MHFRIHKPRRAPRKASGGMPRVRITDPSAWIAVSPPTGEPMIVDKFRYTVTKNGKVRLRGVFLAESFEFPGTDG